MRSIPRADYEIGLQLIALAHQVVREDPEDNSGRLKLRLGEILDQNRRRFARMADWLLINEQADAMAEVHSTGRLMLNGEMTRAEGIRRWCEILDLSPAQQPVLVAA